PTSLPLVLSHLERCNQLLAQHVDNLHGHPGVAGGRWQRIAALYQILLAAWHIAQGDVEYLTVVGGIYQHAIHHGAPIVDLGAEDTGFHVEALDDGGGDHILDVDDQLVPIPLDVDFRAQGLVLDEAAKLAVGAQFDMVNLVDRTIPVVLL